MTGGGYGVHVGDGWSDHTGQPVTGDRAARILATGGRIYAAPVGTPPPYGAEYEIDEDGYPVPGPRTEPGNEWVDVGYIDADQAITFEPKISGTIPAAALLEDRAESEEGFPLRVDDFELLPDGSIRVRGTVPERVAKAITAGTADSLSLEPVRMQRDPMHVEFEATTVDRPLLDRLLGEEYTTVPNRADRRKAKRKQRRKGR
jgi:hypothetical protein